MDADEAAWREFVESTEPPESPRSPGRPDALTLLAIAAVIATIVGIAALWPADTPVDDRALAELAIPSELYAATIESAEEAGCPGAESIDCVVVDFLLTDGPDAGATYTQAFPTSALNPDFATGDTAILARTTPNAVVLDRNLGQCSFDATVECVQFELLISTSDGPDAPATFEEVPEFAPGVFAGDEAIAQFLPGSDELFSLTAPTVELSYQFSGDFQRRSLLWAVLLVFAAVVVGLGLWRGVAALAGLAASLSVLLLFVLPAILSGRSPILVAIVGSAAIAIFTLYLAHGLNRMTTVAMLGMISALVLTAVLSAVTVELAAFSGFASEEAALLSLFEDVDVSGLLLAGIVLGAAGALDDVTVTQASAVWALAAADPGQTQATLFSRALRIGRDHIASTVNTLLLAYAGAALPLLVLFVLSDQSLGAIANSEIVAVEIVRTLVGSIGLVAAVPLTTWLASIAAPRNSPQHNDV